MRRVYLDYAATTPLLPEARAEMEPWLADGFGNPSSNHAEGRRAKQALDEARELFARAFACEFAEIVFTGSATEAANMAIVGLALASETGRKKVLFSGAEHHCVLNTSPLLERLGLRVRLVPARSDSTADIAQLSSLVDEDTLLVAAMHANNETGAITSIAAVADQTNRAGAALVCDAAQSIVSQPGAVGWADLLFAAPHKFGGPKGVGVLCSRSPRQIAALIAGGGQERELRGGTENVAGIVGAAAALKWCLENQTESFKAKARARATFLASVGGHWFAVQDTPHKLPGTAFLWFEGLEADALLIRLDRAGISASSGAACTSGSVEPSHVVVASGFSEERARQCVRFSFGHQTTEEEAAYAGRVVREEVEAMSRLANLPPR